MYFIVAVLTTSCRSQPVAAVPVSADPSDGEIRDRLARQSPEACVASNTQTDAMFEVNIADGKVSSIRFVVTGPDYDETCLEKRLAGVPIAVSQPRAVTLVLTRRVLGGGVAEWAQPRLYTVDEFKGEVFSLPKNTKSPWPTADSGVHD